MSFIGNSLNFVLNENEKYAAKIEITVLLFKGDSVFVMDKYTLNSPEITDTADIKPNFIDIQRYAIKAGNFNMKITIRDLNSPDKRSVFDDIVMINFNDTDLSISGIEYLESYKKTEENNILAKSGFELIPYISNFFPYNVDKMRFYFELYNTETVIKAPFTLKLYVEKVENKEVKIATKKQLKEAPIIPYIGELDITYLPSGNYNLVIEFIDTLQSSRFKEKFFFQRSGKKEETLNNPLFDIEQNVSDIFDGNFDNRDSLMEYVYCLRPIADVNEQQFIDFQTRTADNNALKNFFADFWKKRNATHPNIIWKEYYEQVKYVNRAFGTKTKKGYRCDMGYVYLKYGAPNEISDVPHEPEAYPYQIWKYWKTGTESNRKFVFYNPNIATRDYDLLHSNARGEIFTANWERYLRKRTHDLYNHDATQADDNFGSRALEEFNK
jgi:GWxTD domain-containing protein